jgi:SpoIID/LytB domain protein
MSAPVESIGVRSWTPASRVEPHVRVGVILEQDADRRIALQFPAVDYRLTDAGGRAVETVSAAAQLEVEQVAEGLQTRMGDRRQIVAAPLRLVPTAPPALGPATGVLVRDVIAGRGFHWQKRVDEHLTGILEIRAAGGGLVLVNELPVELYLAGVITAEMGGACPLDLLKAQCVVARSWLLAMKEPKHATEPFDRCNDDCCQRYQGTDGLSAAAIDAVDATRGEILLDPTGGVLDANYAKCCGGISEDPEVVWGVTKPGLTPVVDAPPGDPAHHLLPVTDDRLDEFLTGHWLDTTQAYCSPAVVPSASLGRYLGRVDEVGDYFRWTVRYPRAELETLLRDKLPAARDLAELVDIRGTERGVSGRLKTLQLAWRDTMARRQMETLASEYRIREVLHRRFLYSSAFSIDTVRDADGRLTTITLRGAGWGHGVGLCQIGALGMALRGAAYPDICRHYYPQAQLVRAYD